MFTRIVLAAIALGAFSSGPVLADSFSDTLAKCQDDALSFDTRITSCTQAVDTSLDKQKPTAYAARGMTYGQAGKLDQAINDLGIAVSLDPKLTLGWYNLGYAFLQQNAPIPAVGMFDKAIALDGSNPDFFYYRGLAYQGSKQPDEAIEDFTRTIELKPTQNAEAYQHRAECHRQLGHQTQAAADEQEVQRQSKAAN